MDNSERKFERSAALAKRGRVVVGTSTFSQDLSTFYSIDSKLDPSWIKIDLDPGRTKPRLKIFLEPSMVEVVLVYHV